LSWKRVWKGSLFFTVAVSSFVVEVQVRQFPLDPLERVSRPTHQYLNSVAAGACGLGGFVDEDEPGEGDVGEADEERCRWTAAKRAEDVDADVLAVMARSIG
jgi:hypothetical protein